MSEEIVSTEDPIADSLESVKIEPPKESPLEGFAQEIVNESFEDQKDENYRPNITSAEWSDYVMKHFTDDELVEGCPNADGLRRVAQLLLGPILHSGVEDFDPATPINDFRGTVTYRIKILFSYPENGLTAYPITYVEIADVYPGNCDPEFARHPVATAATRAESRALRKALRLKRIISSEETTSVPIEESGIVESSKITKHQMGFLNVLAERNNINLATFVTGYMKLKNFKKLENIDYETAVQMVAKLSEWQRDKSKIAEKCKGFDTNWKAEVAKYEQQ